ncbi:exonuclease domain-containing protein [Bifidobacterium aquikefiricola]|uniref:Exonuclease domain-containing protein n=1 Tax=Bifidobacterium aquikefiricola TaxID=3059038 RepID=A0AB39U9E0_9BIFI
MNDLAQSEQLLKTLGSAPQQTSETPLSKSWLLGFDTETTGARPGRDAIVSATLVLRNPELGHDHDVLGEWIINPHRHMSPGASKVNGFTDDYLEEHGIEPEEALESITKVIVSAQNSNIPLLAYNAPFDVAMLQHDLGQWKLDTLESRITNDSLLIVDPLVIDRAVSHRSGKRTLSYTTEYYGVEPDGDFHNATADTVAAVDLIGPMTTLYPQVGRLKIGELMAWQQHAHGIWKDSFNQWLTSKGRRPIQDGWFE